MAPLCSNAHRPRVRRRRPLARVGQASCNGPKGSPWASSSRPIAEQDRRRTSHRIAPDLNSGFVHQTVHQAIHGVGPLPSAASTPRRSSSRSRTATSTEAITEVIENHTALAAGAGVPRQPRRAGHGGGDRSRSTSRASPSCRSGWSPASRTCAATTSTTLGSATRSCSARSASRPSRGSSSSGRSPAGRWSSPPPRPTTPSWTRWSPPRSPPRSSGG